MKFIRNLIFRIFCFICAASMLPFASNISVSAEESSFAFLGIDADTWGNWEGKYGSDGYVLLGYDYVNQYSWDSLEDMWSSDWQYIDINSCDLIEWGAIKNYSAVTVPRLRSSKGELSTVEKTEENGSVKCNLLSMPKAVGGKPFPALSVIGKTNSAGEYSGIFRFNMEDDKKRIFTMYSPENSDSGEDNPEMINVPTVIRFYDTRNNLLYEQSFEKNPCSAARYVSFLVQGSFMVEIAFPNRQNGPSGFFFDSYKDIDSDNIQASVDGTNGAVTFSGMKLSGNGTQTLYRSQNGKDVTAVAAAAFSETKLCDTSARPNNTYEYRIVSYGDDGYSVSDPFTVETVKLDKVSLTSSAPSIDITLGDEIAFKLRLTDSAGKPLEGRAIKLIWQGEYIGEYLPEDIGIWETDSDGYANVRFTPTFSGELTIAAESAPEYGNNISDGVLNIPVTVKEVPWTQAPYILRMSDAIKYDEVFSINGEGLNADKDEDICVKAAEFKGYENTPEEPPADAFDLTVIQIDRDGHFLAVKMPKETPAGLYSVWVKNSYGWSRPVTLNDARPLFISEYEVWAGQTIDLSGRNLSAKQFGMEKDYTALRLADNYGNTYIQSLNKVTPYSLNFTVGAEVPLGTYRVEVTNNGGLSWVGLASEQTLTVKPVGKDPLGLGVAWAGDYNWDNRVSVIDFGAAADDKIDDTQAFQKAADYAGASGGGIVCIPEGAFRVSHVNLPFGVVLMGEGSDKTTVYYTGTKDSTIIQSVDSDGDVGLNGVANILITVEDETEFYKNNPNQSHLMWLGNAWSKATDRAKRTATRLFEYGVKTRLPYNKDIRSGGGTVVVAKERFLSLYSDFEGYYGNERICNVNQYLQRRSGRWHYIHGYVHSTAEYTFDIDCKVEGYGDWIDYLRDIDPGGFAHGIFFKESAHIEGCEVNDIGFDSDGEAYCAEQSSGTYTYGDILEAGSDYIKAVTWVPLQEEYAVRCGRIAVLITDGRGLGQRRYVKSISGNTIYLEEPWDVIPNRTSKFNFNSFLERDTVYNCTNKNTTSSVNFYCGGYDNVAADVVSVDGGHSCCIARNSKIRGRFNNSYFVTFRNIKTYGCNARNGEMNQGFCLETTRTACEGERQGIAIYGIEFRDNYGYGVQSQPQPKPHVYPHWNYATYGGGGFTSESSSHGSDSVLGDQTGEISNVIFENNTLTNYKDAYKLGIRNYGFVSRGNNIEGNGNDMFEYEGNADEEMLFLSDKSESSGAIREYNMDAVKNETSGEMFSDLDGYGETKHIINDLCRKGIVSGKAEGVFSPAEPVTRAEFLTMLVRVKKLELIPYKNKFADVSSEDWYADYIQTAFTNSVIPASLVKNSCMNPNAVITREEAALLAACAAGLSTDKAEVSFSDAEKISDFAKPYIAAAVEAKLIIGDENGYRLNDGVSRAEAAIIAGRVMNKIN